MKTLILITFFAIILLPLQILSQIDNKCELNPYWLLEGRVNSITKPDEQIKQRLQSDNFSNSESRTIINKKILDNGFLLFESLYQHWDGSNWVNDSKYSYLYDENNNLIELLEQSWAGSAWVNAFKDSYTYDVNNNRIEALWQDWAGSAWVNSTKYLYTYDMNNTSTETLKQTWDGSNWVNDSKSLYTININYNLIELLLQTWDGSNWVNDSKYSYLYDENNNRIERLRQIWDGSNWVNSYKYTYTYDENNNMIESLGQNWDGTNWENYNKSSNTYIPITAIDKEFGFVNSFSLSNNYPNPFNPSTKITYSVPERSNVSLKVFDLLGSEVVELVKGEIETGTYDINFNASNLPSGVYFYRIQAGSFIETKKMLLLK